LRWIKNKLDGTATSGVIKAVFFSIVIIVSMFATYGFAVTFTPDFAPDFFGAYRSVVSGILMVFMLDGAALAWQYLRLNESKSKKQIEIAEGNEFRSRLGPRSSLRLLTCC
jgi:uncharacterized membrane protein YbhN (UPF0104 family)